MPLLASSITTISSQGLDFEEMMNYARKVPGEALRQMTFQERGQMLKKLALHLHSIRKKYYPISYQTGATKGDSWIDIDGGIGTLFAYASLRRKFPNETFYVDGEAANLSKEGTFIGHHIMVPKQGVAIHINAFNFSHMGDARKSFCQLIGRDARYCKGSRIRESTNSGDGAGYCGVGNFAERRHTINMRIGRGDIGTSDLTGCSDIYRICRDRTNAKSSSPIL